ncbi:hypothetical protein [uncultured Dokdonia sp.]|uniref:hypothetical protein n=1 Tax=uncultured Dokdonia sp. TaxID=575653 RepID=UPI002630F08D|nr:hypothetical protein [uncultured Dokdonia sp.]
MTRSYALSISVLLFLTMSQCASFEKLSTPEFIGDASYYRTWVAGVKGGGSGMDFYIDINDVPASVELLTLYFKEYNAQVFFEANRYVAHFKTPMNTSTTNGSTPDITPKKKPPFEITEEEAILMYKKEGKEYYTKIQKITNKGHIAFPSAGGPNSKH